MRVLHVIGGMNPDEGGVCQGLRTIVSGLTDMGVHNEVVTLDPSNASYFDADKFVVHPVGKGISAWHYNPKLIQWLIKNIASFDAIMVHGIWRYHSYAVNKAMRYLRNNNLKQSLKINITLPKVFIFPQGMLDPYFQRALGRKLKALRNWLFWKIIEGRVINESNGVMFTCETERLLAKVPFNPYRPKREVVIGMGIEAPPPYTVEMREAFLKKCPGLRDRPYLLFLSRINEKKGTDLLIQAYSSIAKEVAKNNESTKMGINRRFENSEWPDLVIAGPGLDTSYGKKITEFASSSKELINSVFFPGMLTDDAKWGAFYGCDAFVLPSHQENFGIAVVEALACSKPVLISNQVNIWREIAKADGGLIENDNNEGIIKLLECWNSLSLEEKNNMGLNAKKSFMKDFAIEPTAKRILDTFNNQ